MKTEKVNGKRIACYDSGKDDGSDRYTVSYLDWELETNGFVPGVGMNATPFHPQGIGQHCSMVLGRHLGKRIPFASMPEDCQRLVRQDMAD